MMDGVEIITAYKTSDGKIFYDKENANDHQIDINIREKISTIVDEIYYSGIDSECIVNGIMEHAGELKALL